MKQPLVNLKLMLVVLLLSNILSLGAVAFLGSRISPESCLPPAGDELVRHRQRPHQAAPPVTSPAPSAPSPAQPRT
jgi:hypothetical protein